MSESITAEKEGQIRKKPPRSIGRIAGEILTGTGRDLLLHGRAYR